MGGPRAPAGSGGQHCPSEDFSLEALGAGALLDSSQARVLLAQTSRGWLFSVLYSLSFSLFYLPLGSLGGAGRL